MRELTCDNCRFFEGLSATSDIGECRRHAPHPVPRTDDLHYDVAFPLTSFLHWCGEHQPTPPQSSSGRA